MTVFSNPVCQRSLSLIQKYIQDGSVAYYLGAGVDKLLLDDNAIESAPSWKTLVTDLYKKPFEDLSRANLSSSEVLALDDLANNFPNELASSARWSLGDDKFHEEIKKKFTESMSIDFNTMESTHNLCKLLSRASLIITTNYSNYIYQALCNYIKYYNPEKKIVVLSREDMASFTFSDSNNDPNIIKFIYLHGRCSNGSYPILDAWGYNIAQNDDAFYVDFLNNLFLSKHVITIGTSWTDIPLRNSAALVMRTRPYVNQCHIAFSRKNDLDNSKSVCRSWANAMKGAYGVCFVNVKNNTAKLMDYLGSGLNKPKLRDYDKLANFLDETGDYESVLQSNFLNEECHYPGDPHERISNTVEIIYDNLKSYPQDISWETTARIERHMRHHIYLYTSNTNRNKNNEKRKDLWNKLRENIPSISKWSRIDDRLKFDFIVGGWEIYGAAPNGLPPYYKRLPKLFRDRLDIVENYDIWMKTADRLEKCKRVKDTETEFEEIVLKLLDTGWESMAAKVLCDKTAFLAEFYRDKTREGFLYANKVVDQAIRAEAIARSVGCYRRRIKADVINAIWNPDSKASRVVLLGRLRANEAIQSIEPGLLDSLGLGLLVCYLKSKNYYPSTPIEKAEALGIFHEVGLTETHLRRALSNYWKPLMPEEIDSCFNNLRKTLNII